MKWLRWSIFWALFVIAVIAVQDGTGYMFGLSQEQAGWLDAAICCVIILGVVAWQRWGT
jgi:hypothetical protein